MSTTKSNKLFLTLFISFALVLAITPSVTANSFYSEHANHRRLIKKRAPLPQGGLLPVGGAAPAPPTFSSTPLPSSTSATATNTSEETSATPSPSSTESEATSVSNTSAASSTTGSSSASESSTSDSSSTSAASTSSTAQPPAAPTSESLNVTGAPAPNGTKGPGGVVTRTESVNAPSASPPPNLSANSSNNTKTMTFTIIIAIAASVGGIAIIWTIFRKWKLGRSAKFDERLRPVDWQPTAPNDDDGIISGHRRMGSGTSFSSRSAHGHSGARGYGGSDIGHGSSDHGHGAASLGPLPDHDFTAPANLAPVGGYADLARGHSPQPPQMQESYHRGPAGYDAGVPLHHQSGYGGGRY